MLNKKFSPLKVYLLVFAIFASFLVSGQAKKQINFGTGAAIGYSIPTYFSFEIPIHSDVTIAPSIIIDLGLQSYSAGVKGAFYFDNLLRIDREFDLYASANISYINWTNELYEDVDPEMVLVYGGMDIGIGAGARWFWSKNMGFNIEVDTGVHHGNVTLGLTYVFD